MDPSKSKSQINFENSFAINTDPVLNAQELEFLNSADDVPYLCEKINDKLQHEHATCIMQ